MSRPGKPINDVIADLLGELVEALKQQDQGKATASADRISIVLANATVREVTLDPLVFEFLVHMSSTALSALTLRKAYQELHEKHFGVRL